ncbi:MAG: tail fiber protein [Pseudomonadota bacterium]
MINMMKKTAIALATTCALSGPSLAAPETFVGDLQLVPYNYCPRGTLEAAGQLLQINNHQSLFALYGNMYGGNGRTTFGLPDLRGRVAVGVAQGQNNFGTRFGTETVTLVPQNLPSHNHRVNTGSPNASPNPAGAAVSDLPAGVNAFSQSTTPNGNTMNNAVIGTTGGNIPFSVVAPSLAMKWCVTVQGVFPPRN